MHAESIVRIVYKRYPSLPVEMHSLPSLDPSLLPSFLQPTIFLPYPFQSLTCRVDMWKTYIYFGRDRFSLLACWLSYLYLNDGFRAHVYGHPCLAGHSLLAGSSFIVRIVCSDRAPRERARTDGLTGWPWGPRWLHHGVLWYKV